MAKTESGQTSRRQRVPRGLLGVVAIGAFILAGASPALAHTDTGELQLFIDNVEVSPHDGGATIRAEMVDFDTQDQASGFAMHATAVNPAGEAVGPVELGEVGRSGTYEGDLELADGRWTVTLSGDQGNAAIAAIATNKRVAVTVGAGADGGGGSGGGSGDDGGSSAGVIVGAVGGIAAVGLGALAVSRRRRRAAAGAVGASRE